MEAIRDVEGARFPVLTPNLKVHILCQRNIQFFIDLDHVHRIIHFCVDIQFYGALDSVELLYIIVFLSYRVLKQLLQQEPRK